MLNKEDEPAAVPHAAKPRSLWRNTAFLQLWAGQTISAFGSLVTGVALPFAAILALNASPFQMSLLSAAGIVPALLMAPVAGVWADRLRRRPILIGADLGRAVLLGTIPAAAFAGILGLKQLYLVTFLVGILGIFFDVAYRSYLPSIVPTEDLTGANSKLSATSSIAEVGAFSLAGWLVQILTAPLAILIDAVSFVFSAVLIGLIRTPEPEPVRRRRDLWNEIAKGKKVVAENPILRAFAIAVAISSLGGGLFGAQYSLFALKGLGFKPGILGMIYGLGGVSSLLGALMAERISNRLGAGRSMVIGLGIFGAGQFLVPMARGATWLSASLMIGQQLTDGAFIVYFINQTTLKQTITPNHLLGRVNATLRFAMLSSTLAGSLLSGLIAQFLGLRMTLGVGAASTIFAALWLSRSPVWAIVRADGSFAATFCATD